MSEGTLGLSRRKWTLSNWIWMTCLIAPLAELSWQPPAAAFAACTGIAAVAIASEAQGSIAATRKRKRRVERRDRDELIGLSLLEPIERPARCRPLQPVSRPVLGCPGRADFRPPESGRARAPR